MNKTGKITKINSDLGYGFVQVPKLGDVFFSSETKFDGTVFGSLKVDDSVNISVTETERGLFAASLALQVRSQRPHIPEANL